MTDVDPREPQALIEQWRGRAAGQYVLDPVGPVSIREVKTLQACANELETVLSRWLRQQEDREQGLLRCVDVLTEIDELLGVHDTPVTAPDEIKRLLADLARLRELAKESNAVCACGCPVGDHENYGEDGQSCGHEDHDCVCTSKSVLAMLEKLRAKPVRQQEQAAPASDLREFLLAIIEQHGCNDHQWLVGKAMDFLAASVSSPAQASQPSDKADFVRLDRERREAAVDRGHAAPDLAPSEAPAQASWQAIETAPKDGTAIIGALICDGKVWRVHDMKHNGLAFYTVNGGSLPAMTHWQPLPAPPSQEESR